MRSRCWPINVKPHCWTAYGRIMPVRPMKVERCYRRHSNPVPGWRWWGRTCVSPWRPHHPPIAARRWRRSVRNWMRKIIATPEVAYAFAWPSTARNRSLNEKLRSGDLNVELNMTQELATLRRLTPRELRARYAELFGDQPRTGNKGWLLRRLAWRLQSLAEGDLSQRARQ